MRPPWRQLAAALLRGDCSNVKKSEGAPGCVRVEGDIPTWSFHGDTALVLTDS